MRHFIANVFDEFVPSALTATPVYTSADFNARLAQCDQLAVQVVCDNFTGSPFINVQLEHSSDGRTWVPKTPPLINNQPTTLAAPSVFGADTGGIPTLGFARLAFWCSGVTAIPMHVKIHVTARDSR